MAESESFSVSCGSLRGVLHPSNFGPGCRSLCIEFKDKMLTPNEFQDLSGQRKNWKTNIKTSQEGKSLKNLIEDGTLKKCPSKCTCHVCKTSKKKIPRRSSTHENIPADPTPNTSNPVNPGPNRKTGAVSKLERGGKVLKPLHEKSHQNCTSNCQVCASPMKSQKLTELLIDDSLSTLETRLPNTSLHFPPQGLLQVAETITSNPNTSSTCSVSLAAALKMEMCQEDDSASSGCPDLAQSTIAKLPALDYVSMIQEAIASLSLGSSTPDGFSQLHVLLYILNNFHFDNQDISVILTKLRKAMAFMLRMGILHKNTNGEMDESDSEEQTKVEETLEQTDKEKEKKHSPKKKVVKDKEKTENGSLKKKKKTNIEVNGQTEKKKEKKVEDEHIQKKKVEEKSDKKVKKSKLTDEQKKEKKENKSKLTDEEKKENKEKKLKLTDEQNKDKKEKKEKKLKQLKLTDEQRKEKKEKKLKLTDEERKEKKDKLREKKLKKSKVKEGEKKEKKLKKVKGVVAKVALNGRLKSLSPALSAVVGVHEMHRYEVVRQVWKYIRANNLQNPDNKNEITCDEKLRALTKMKIIGQPGIISAIAKNLKDIPTEKRPKTDKSPNHPEIISTSQSFNL